MLLFLRILLNISVNPGWKQTIAFKIHISFINKVSWIFYFFFVFDNHRQRGISIL